MQTELHLASAAWAPLSPGCVGGKAPSRETHTCANTVDSTPKPSFRPQVKAQTYLPISLHTLPLQWPLCTPNNKISSYSHDELERAPEKKMLFNDI